MMNVPVSSQVLDPQQKKLLFRSWHRGTREADLLMGRFAESFLPQASADDLDLYETLLDENDPDIFDWVTGKEALPDKPFTDVLRRFIDFYKTGA